MSMRKKLNQIILKKEENGEFNCKVITKIDIDKFREILMQALTE